MDFRVPQLPAGPAPCMGITGLSACSHYIYAALQRPRLSSEHGDVAHAALLILLLNDLSPAGYYEFQLARDIHSVLIDADELYSVSTGTDEVVRLRMRGSKVVSESVLWRPEPEAPRADIHHLNAIYKWRDQLLVCALGRKAGELWSSAKDGFIANLSTGGKLAERIYHPHSMVEIDADLAYCESSTGTVKLLSGEWTRSFPGYTRGMCIAGDRLFVATSIGRRVSRRTGIIHNAADPGEPAGRCMVSRLSLQSLEIEDTKDLSSYANEIYDLLPVPDTTRWPMVSDSPLLSEATPA